MELHWPEEGVVLEGDHWPGVEAEGAGVLGQVGQHRGRVEEPHLGREQLWWRNTIIYYEVPIPHHGSSGGHVHRVHVVAEDEGGAGGGGAAVQLLAHAEQGGDLGEERG